MPETEETARHGGAAQRNRRCQVRGGDPAAGRGRGRGYAAYLHYRNRVSSDDAKWTGTSPPSRPRSPATCVEVLVNDNQPVKAGDVLVRIDPRDYQAAGGPGQGRTGAGREPVERGAGGGAVDRSTPPQSGNHAGVGAGGGRASGTGPRAPGCTSRPPAPTWLMPKPTCAAEQASNDRAQADLARMKPLVDKAEISQLQYDAYVAAAAWRTSDLQARAGEAGIGAARMRPSARRR